MQVLLRVWIAQHWYLSYSLFLFMRHDMYMFICKQVAVIDILGAYLGFADLSAFKILRVLRALRPLRAVSRWQNMKVCDTESSFFENRFIGSIIIFS